MHLVVLSYLLVFLIPIVVSTLLHLSELHLGAFDLALELLYLPLVSVIVLQFVPLFF